MNLIVVFLCVKSLSIDWSIETVDTLYMNNELNYNHSLALDSNEIAHMIFNKNQKHVLKYATRIAANNWVKETVDSGLFYACPKIAFDRNNIAHCSYFEVTGNLARLYHAYRDSTGWIKTPVDSILGIITNYWFSFGYFYTSMALDTLNRPAIAFISWDPADSVFYVKCDRFNGITWDTTVVEYDSAWSPHVQPSDWSPSLKINHNNTTYLTYYHIFSQYDTIKLARWSDSINNWIKEPSINEPYGGVSIEMGINQQDKPSIAHGVDVGLCWSYFDSLTWQTEYTGIDIGWISTHITMDLDQNDKPHIFFHGDPLTGLGYCYKDSVWNTGVWLDTAVHNHMGEVCLELDRSDSPHVSFRFSDFDTAGVKYAKGTILGVSDENGADQIDPISIVLYPNPFRNKIRIAAGENLELGCQFLNIYDITGRLVKRLDLRSNTSGRLLEFYWDGKDDKDNSLPSGIYFVQLKSRGGMFTKKIIKLE